MKLRIDQEADALYFSLDDSPIVESEEVSPGIILDYDAQDRVVGIEMLRISKRLPEADLSRVLFETSTPALSK